MIKHIDDIKKLSMDHNIPFEDVLFISLNATGLNADFPYKRLRFRLSPAESDGDFFFGLPVRPGDSPFSYKHVVNKHEGALYLDDRLVGYIHEAFDDTCDSTYPRRGGTVLNLNSMIKSSCSGCSFCTTVGQTPNDRANFLSESQLRSLFDNFRDRYDKPDLSHIVQVALVTGCFRNERRLVAHLRDVRRILRDYNFNGEIFYFGSEIVSDESFDILKEEAKPFAFCLSVECFTRRNTLLRDTKSRMLFDDLLQVLNRSKMRGFQTNFSYILGLDSIEEIRSRFPQLIQLTNRFPIINVFQPHYNPDQSNLRIEDSRKIEYYLSARKYFEGLYKGTNLRPRTWENYRPLWYTTFANEKLNGMRLP